MTREQIEKATYSYTLNDKEGTKDFYELNAKEEIVRTAFIAGAHWRISSVWHDDISECKDVKRWLVVEYNNGYVDVLPDIRDLDGVKDLVVRVAYLDDLLPERKEETK